MDELTPLERLYFENASKDDLIAEVMQLRSELKELRGAVAENNRLKREVQKLYEFKQKLENMQKLHHKYRAKLNEKRGTSKKIQCIELHEQGFSVPEISRNVGCSARYARHVIHEVCAYKKAMQKQG